MKFTALVLLILSSFFVEASKYGHWSYELPSSSAFLLVEENNGLYLQFSGETTLTADLLIQRLNESDLIAWISVSENDLAKLPYRITSKIHLAKTIQLVNASHLSEHLAPAQLSELSIGEKYKVGVTQVKIVGLNSGGDCGFPNFFVFDYEILRFNASELVELNESSGCQQDDKG